MIPAAFDYVLAESAENALALLAEHGDEAKLLAGGHSLLPLMKYRLAAPGVLIDIGRLDDLSYVRDEGDELAIGALTKHREVETNSLITSQIGLLAAATAQVGDPQVRHRGTLGGALAHGDPASDLPAALIALRGSVVIDGPSGRRQVAADDFFIGFLETALAEDEMLVEIRVPKMPDAQWSFQKFNRRAQDWAIVGAAVVVNNGQCGVGLVNMDARPIRASAVETAVNAGATATEAAEQAAEGCEPSADLNAGVEYRKHLARVLTRRGLEESGR
ncbi:MAG TPA: xanthine dehydrogenase family protein subunit M [Acidimicrobiia bacterium]|jgi:carbon-monoxide dehydrogenase medium subunit|nr:xanthine dehydrogenase family protein subunit M [Actinomycetota bacterium]HIG25241.1 xanthine dehydrogenase family protein subunit M [Acidimicrobiia bacterium]MBT3747283.1 xanthine dehydrogenase family protein subunit M [Actinomycetota bacterium]MBT3969867.1 xanthine dehydrogenase family protein subunit M [Actinomycetota bacterium]MBT4009045.1 xanthine dehydrogenase family protein subunit M [Actinomycetota bacterium]